jgi:general secretion pathway protein G
MKRLAGSEGYTLLELLVVIAILALIVAFAAPQVLGYFSRSKTQAGDIEISNIVAALDLYRLDVGSYPTTDQGLSALLDKPEGAKNWHGPYLTRRDGIIDPWGRPYLYQGPEGSNTFLVQSYGGDGKPGGSGENQDLTSNH